MSLRPYQADLVQRVAAEFGAHPAVVLQLPTGGGKTHIAAHVAREAAQRGERVWLICHRREIVRQTSGSLGGLGVAHGVVSAGYEPDQSQLVQVCSVGSVARRAGQLPSPDLIIWDEAHHVASRSWSALRTRYPNAQHLGLTATPVRLDGKGLDAHFDALICGPTTADLMAAGHLSRYRLFAPTIPDLRGVGVRAGDYAKDDLAGRMSGATLVGDVVEHYQRIAPGSRAVAFAVSVEASRVVVARFNAAGIPAAHIDGTTSHGERDAAIADLEAGRIRVLSNVEVFTEGFDLPAIDAVILLRPTRSFALYRQMIGRGLRTAPGKGPTVILDHAGLVYEHDLPDEPVEWSLAGVKKRKGAGVERLRRCPECSAIHTWSFTCTECGHVYTIADRTIREVYGELREVGAQRRDEPPPGFDTARGFARRANTDPAFIRRCFEQGLPRTTQGHVPVAAGLAWLRGRRTSHNRPPPDSEPGQFEKQIDFARRIGMSKSGLSKLVERGLPTGSNGWVHVEPALRWVRLNRSGRAASEGARQTGGLIGETVCGFARLVGASPERVRRAKRLGLPLEADGSIAVEAGRVWWAAHPADARGFRAARATA